MHPSLFPLDGFERFGVTSAPIATGLWHLCLSTNEDDIRAEISLSKGVEGGNFSGFIERIFLLKKGEWSNFSIIPEDRREVVEFEPIVIRKK